MDQHNTNGSGQNDTTMSTDDDVYKRLAEAAEAGQLKPAGNPTYRDGSYIAPGASIEDAVYVAMGRPRLDATSKPTKTWKIRATESLDTKTHTAAKQHNMTLSEYVRLAVAEKTERDQAAV